MKKIHAEKALHNTTLSIKSDLSKRIFKGDQMFVIFILPLVLILHFADYPHMAVAITLNMHFRDPYFIMIQTILKNLLVCK